MAMLKQLRIKNFKGWADTGTIRMAPITLFFGTNSSGKSSIGQFLMMLKQTMESPDRKAVFYPGGKNSAVQLGSFQDMVFHHKYKEKIEFNYRWTLGKSLKVSDPISKVVFEGEEISFFSSIGLHETTQNPTVFNFSYELYNKENSVFSLGMERKSGDKSEYKVKSTQYDLVRKPGRVWFPGAPVRFYGFPDEVVAYHQNADFVRELSLIHEKLFRSLYYLGPLRMKAERLYSWSGIEPDGVGFSGENTVAAILAAQKRQLNLGYKRPLKVFEEVIALELKKMGLIEGFKVNPISEQRQEYEVKVRTWGSEDWVDLPDVGFGISQVMPVLVQCFYAPVDSIILMEQPEIHLHPRAQSALADVFIDVINSREDGSDRNIQLIIETHSEHFLRRLQRRIAEDVISQDSVAAYFADIVHKPAKLEPLQIDGGGNIINWPKDFFGDEATDIIEQNKAALSKIMKERQAQKKEQAWLPL